MTWLLQKKIRLHRELFDKGFLVAAAGHEKVVPESVTNESFVIGSRVLKFFHPAGNPIQIKNMPSPEELHRTCTLLVNMLQTSQSGIETFLSLNQVQADSESAKSTKKNEERKFTTEKIVVSIETGISEPPILDGFSELFISDGYKQSPGIYVTHSEQSHIYREIYLPIVFQCPKKPDQEMGLYVHPWSTKTTGDFEAKIKTWVSAGRLFGSSIQGYNQYGSRGPFIKYDQKFYDSEQIMAIDCDEESSYERMNAEEFERVVGLIAQVDGMGKNLFYNLPGLEYVVFAYELFGEEKITTDALDTYFDHIFLRIQQHAKRINAICIKYGINVIVLSSFENLLNIPLSSINSKEAFIKAIHRTFDPLIKNKDPSKNWKSQLVDFCLQRMLSGDVVSTKQRQLWQVLLENIGRDKINTVGDLFHVANQLPLLLASEGNVDCETCSVLPGTERVIQTSYATMKDENNNFPHIMFLTYADIGVGYYPAAGKNNGSLFYFNHDEEKTLLETMNITTLSAAASNIRAFADHTGFSTPLENVLGGINPPAPPSLVRSKP